MIVELLPIPDGVAFDFMIKRDAYIRSELASAVSDVRIASGKLRYVHERLENLRREADQSSEWIATHHPESPA